MGSFMDRVSPAIPRAAVTTQRRLSHGPDTAHLLHNSAFRERGGFSGAKIVVTSFEERDLFSLFHSPQPRPQWAQWCPVSSDDRQS